MTDLRILKEYCQNFHEGEIRMLLADPSEGLIQVTHERTSITAKNNEGYYAAYLLNPDGYNIEAGIPSQNTKLICN